MIESFGIGALLAVLVATRPRAALWVGMLLPLAQTVYSPPLLRLVILAVMIGGLALGWPKTLPRQRAVVVLVNAGVTFTLVIGWVLAVSPTLAQGVVVNLIFSSVLASLAVVFGLSATEWCAYLMLWGAIVSRWLVWSDVVVSGRSGDLYAGENANGLGTFAALGFVSAMALIATRGTRRMLRITALAVMPLCGLGLVASGSRGALLVVTVGAVSLVWAMAEARSRPLILASGLALAMFVTAGSSGALDWFVQQSGRQIGAGSLLGREAVLRQAIRIGMENPLSGVGFGGLEHRGLGAFAGLSAHNVYLGLFAATGLVPTLMLAVLAVAAVRRSLTYSGHQLFPLVFSLLAAGASLDWIPAAKLGAFALGILASSVALGSKPKPATPPEQSTKVGGRSGRVGNAIEPRNRGAHE